MAAQSLQQIVAQLRAQPPTTPFADVSRLLSRAKLLLLQLNALTPTANTNPAVLALARETYELGALASIRVRNPDAFTRYVEQLKPFYYELPSPSGNSSGSSSGGSGKDAAAAGPRVQQNKVIGLYLLLLLTQGLYSDFHSELESLASRDGAGCVSDVENDRYLGYPIRLERWLMEGSYDRVWHAMKSQEVPCEEYGVFSEILTGQIRSEIAGSSERAYPSLPLSSTKSLLFLDSEGAVIEFAHHRGWTVKDGCIYFSDDQQSLQQQQQQQHMVIDGEEGDAGDAASVPAAGLVPAFSEKGWNRAAIEKTLGYARELETIV